MPQTKAGSVCVVLRSELSQDRLSKWTSAQHHDAAARRRLPAHAAIYRRELPCHERFTCNIWMRSVRLYNDHLTTLVRVTEVTAHGDTRPQSWAREEPQSPGS